jgi:hypothetical protein
MRWSAWLSYQESIEGARPRLPLFSSGPETGGPATRVLGPYHSVRLSGKGIWAWRNDGTESVRVATQATDSLSWELDGFDDPLWGDVRVIAPPRLTTAREIEAGSDWIRPS